MSRNGKHNPPRPRIELRHSPATPEQAAAIAAAIEQFLRDTTPASAPVQGRQNPWQRAGLFEGAGLALESPSPWGDPDRWGA